MTVGERIAKRREELGYTQEELAKMLGYAGRSAISKLEARDNIKLNTISKIAKVLDCSETYLLGMDNSVPKFEDSHVKVIELYSQLDISQKIIIIDMMKKFIEIQKDKGNIRVQDIEKRLYDEI